MHNHVPELKKQQIKLSTKCKQWLSNFRSCSIVPDRRKKPWSVSQKSQTGFNDKPFCTSIKFCSKGQWEWHTEAYNIFDGDSNGSQMVQAVGSQEVNVINRLPGYTTCYKKWGSEYQTCYVFEIVGRLMNVGFFKWHLKTKRFCTDFVWFLTKWQPWMGSEFKWPVFRPPQFWIHYIKKVTCAATIIFKDLNAEICFIAFTNGE